MTETDFAPAIGFGSRSRRSCYFEATRRYGCKAYSIYNHTLLPLVYESAEADYWRLVNDVALWDVACERQVEITGPDAARFVQLLTPRNLSKLAVGQCKYVLITADDGGLINDPVLLRLDENHFWLSLADSDVLLWARGVAVHSGMDVTICEPDVSPLQVQGPKSRDVMRDLFGDWVTDLRYFWFKDAELAGAPVIVSRTGYSSELGYEIFLRDGRFGDALWEAVMEAGKPYNIGPGGPSTIRRVEAGMLSYGSDATITDNPFELGFDRLVDLDQDAEFVGKAALRRIKADGVTRRWVGLEIEGPPLAAPNPARWPALGADGTQEIGELTSAVYSPRLEKNIGMAMLGIAEAEMGNGIVLETSWGRRRATVVPMPFYDPKKQIPSQG